jgi:hypothetical protein
VVAAVVSEQVSLVFAAAALPILQIQAVVAVARQLKLQLV